MNRSGKVRGQTPRVDKNAEQERGKPKNRKQKKKPKKRGEKAWKINKQVEKWEDTDGVKKSKQHRNKLRRKERLRSNQSSKNTKRNRKKILNEYNNFFEFFNLPILTDYSKLVKFVQKKEVAVLLSEEERMKVANSTNWKRNRNFKLLANILAFEETHEILRKKFQVCDCLVDRLSVLLDESMERSNDDDDNQYEDDSEDQIIDVIRAIANLSVNETFLPELYTKHRLLELLLTHKYFPYCIVSKVPYRIQLERTKIISSLSIEPKVFLLLRQKSEKLIEPLIDLTRQKGMIGELMQIFWTWVVYHEDDYDKSSKTSGKKEDDYNNDDDEEEEGEGEDEEKEEKEEQQGHEFKSAFIDNYIETSENQELIKEKILSVCEVLEEYSENLIRVEIPTTLLVSEVNAPKQLNFHVSPRRTGVIMFRSVYRGRGLGGGGGKCHKPIIYLYPPAGLPTQVSVGLDFKGGAGLPFSGLTTTIPDVQNWKSLEVSEGSRIRDLTSGKFHRYLFWEGDLNDENLETISQPTSIDVRSVVSKLDVNDYLTKAITKLCLIGCEIDDFMEYWTPVFEYLPFDFFEIGFLGTEKWSEFAKLNITPTPQLIIRLFMVFRGMDECNDYEKPEEIPDLHPRNIDRDGKFVVVEWGGMMI